MAKKGTPYNHRAWPSLRQFILDRDGYRCQLDYPGCKQTATVAGHIIAWTPQEPELWLAPTNLRAECTYCSVVERNRRVAGLPPMTAVATPSREW